MNYADADIAWTRIHEFKHFHPERPDTGKTCIVREYPRSAQAGDEPYYRVETTDNLKLLLAYQELARREAPHVTFGGRLGAYKYLDMDDAIADALCCYKKMAAHIR
jgi:UDP-galactopyranose mutase